MSHPLVRLAKAINCRFLEERFGAVYTDGAGRPPLPTRLMAGLAILKHTYNLSDEAVCALWIENPYYQYFCGEEFFQHELPLDRSSMTNWRNRMGEERLQALLQESLAVATRTGAMKPGDLARVVIDTTVQPKNMTFPTDAKLVNRAREKLVKLAKRLGVKLRQSYARVGKIELIQHQRYAHARQFKRARKAVRKLNRLISAASSAISNARSPTMIFSRPRSRGRSILPAGCANRNAGSAAPRSTACMPQRSNASARESRTSPMSSASR
jgi:IS5 family transposase